MKVYTITNSNVTLGAVLDNSYATGTPVEERFLHLGDYSQRGTKVRMFKKNPPNVDVSSGKPASGVIYDAHPFNTDNGYVLAKPSYESDDILVLIRMGIPSSSMSSGANVGIWSFDSDTTRTPEAIEQTIAKGTGSFPFQNDRICWHDALVVMKMGDSLTLHDRDGINVYVKYGSAEIGPEIETPVRMILQDYDGAPDGVGMYTKLVATFPSREKALKYKRVHMRDMYWGRIETLGGKLVQTLEERL